MRWWKRVKEDVGEIRTSNQPQGTREEGTQNSFRHAVAPYRHRKSRSDPGLRGQRPHPSGRWQSRRRCTLPGGGSKLRGRTSPSPPPAGRSPPRWTAPACPPQTPAAEKHRSGGGRRGGGVKGCHFEAAFFTNPSWRYSRKHITHRTDIASRLQSASPGHRFATPETQRKSAAD